MRRAMCLPCWEFSTHVQYRIGRAESLRWYRARVLSAMSVYHFRALFRHACGQSNNRDTLIKAGRQGVILYLPVKIRTLYSDT